MKPKQRHQRAKELYLDICDLQPTERSAFLDKECSIDSDLRVEVEFLLAHHGNPTSSALRIPTAQTNDTAQSTAAHIMLGQHVNHYQIVTWSSMNNSAPGKKRWLATSPTEYTEARLSQVGPLHRFEPVDQIVERVEILEVLVANIRDLFDDVEVRHVHRLLVVVVATFLVEIGMDPNHCVTRESPARVDHDFGGEMKREALVVPVLRQRDKETVVDEWNQFIGNSVLRDQCNLVCF